MLMLQKVLRVKFSVCLLFFFSFFFFFAFSSSLLCKMTTPDIDHICFLFSFLLFCISC